MPMNNNSSATENVKASAQNAGDHQKSDPSTNKKHENELKSTLNNSNSSEQAKKQAREELDKMAIKY